MSTLDGGTQPTVTGVSGTAPKPSYRPSAVMGRAGRRARSLAWYASVTIPVSVAALFAKMRWLENIGYLAAARATGRQSISEFSALDRLSFVRNDLLLAAVVLPLLAIVLAALVRPRLRAWVVLLPCIVLILAIWAETRALSVVGSFIPAALWWSAFRFAMQRPDLVASHVPLPGIIKTSVAVGAAIALAIWAAMHDPDLRPHRQIRPAVRRPVAAAWALAVALGLAAWLPGGRTMSLHRSYISSVLASLFSHPEEDPGQFAALSLDQLGSRYREIVHASVSPQDPRYWGRAPHANIVELALETVPARCLDLRGSLDDMPNLQRMRRHAIVALKQHITFPYSSLSNFSTLTSLYPPPMARAYMEEHAGERIPSLLWTLRARGYRTALYQPYPARIEDDPDMYRELGFERQVTRSLPSAAATWQSIAHADSVALDALLEDIRAYRASGQPYVMYFAPEITHGPWHDVTGGQARTAVERCHALVRIYDGWIGTIAAAAEAGGGPGAIVLVTGDHGLRTSDADTSFRTETLNDYSFHVPLLIYAPMALDSTLYVDVVTSNIDIAPTLLDLLGVARDRNKEQGNTLWDPQLAHRTTFLLASTYYGADAVYRDSSFAAWSRFTNTVWVTRGDSLDLGTVDIQPVNSPNTKSVPARIERFYRLQLAWLSRVPVSKTSPLVPAPEAPRH